MHSPPPAWRKLRHRLARQVQSFERLGRDRGRAIRAFASTNAVPEDVVRHAIRVSGSKVVW
jgi:hypothetical protein